MTEFVENNLIYIALVLILIVPLSNMFRKKDEDDILFISKEFTKYKIISTAFIVITVLFLFIGVASVLNENVQSVISRYFSATVFSVTMLNAMVSTYALIFLSSFLSFPRKLVLTNNSLYYVSRFKNQYKICDGNRIRNYKVEDDGKLKLTYETKNNTLKNQVIFGKLTKEERINVIKIINERFLVEL